MKAICLKDNRVVDVCADDIIRITDDTSCTLQFLQTDNDFFKLVKLYRQLCKEFADDDNMMTEEQANEFFKQLNHTAKKIDEFINIMDKTYENNKGYN